MIDFDHVGECEYCGTQIAHDELDAINGDDRLFHARCLSDRFSERLGAVQEMVKISQETGQYDPTHDIGGD